MEIVPEEGLTEMEAAAWARTVLSSATNPPISMFKPATVTNHEEVAKRKKHNPPQARRSQHAASKLHPCAAHDPDVVLEGYAGYATAFANLHDQPDFASTLHCRLP